MGFCKCSEAEIRHLDDGITLELMAHNEDMFSLKSTIPAGVAKKAHAHKAVQIYLITEGKMEITVGDETQIVTAGDSVIVPSNVPHSARAIEKSVEIEFFNDPREDVLDRYFR